MNKSHVKLIVQLLSLMFSAIIKIAIIQVAIAKSDNQTAIKKVEESKETEKEFKNKAKKFLNS